MKLLVKRYKRITRQRNCKYNLTYYNSLHFTPINIKFLMSVADLLDSNPCFCDIEEIPSLSVNLMRLFSN